MINLNPNEKAFLNAIKDREDLNGIAYLLNAALTGQDLHGDQIDQVIDYCNDTDVESSSTGLPVPNYIAALRNLFLKIASSPGTTPDIIAQQLGGAPKQPIETKPLRIKKPKIEKDPNEIKPVKIEKYSKTELNTEEIPPYLVEISQIIDKIVAAKCADVYKENADLKAKLAKFKDLLGV